MQTTFANGLSPSFKGKANRAGVPAFVENGGIRTIGGHISKANTDKAYFGNALYVNPAKPNEFFTKKSATATAIAGILLNRQAVNQGSPGHADWLFNEQPADAIYQGSVWVKLNDATAPAMNATVYALDADGTLGTASASSTAINAVVKQYDADTGLTLIYIG